MSRLNYATIIKRSNSINAIKHYNENSNDYSKVYLNNIRESLNEDIRNASISDKTKSNINLLFNNMNLNENEATMYGVDIVNIIGDISDISESYGNNCQNTFCSNILPYSLNLLAIEEAALKYNLYTISNQARLYEASDRILNNHKKIFERFDESFMDNNISIRNIDRVCDEICSMVYTYDINPAAKINICIEEVCYLLDKNSLNYDKGNLIKNITEYFMLIENSIDEKEMGLIEKVLKEGYYLDENDISGVNYLFNKDSITDTSVISGTLKAIVLGQIELSQSVFHDISENYLAVDVDNNLIDLLECVYKLFRYNNISIDEMGSIISGITSGILEAQINRDPIGEKHYLSNCIDTFNKFIHYIKESKDISETEINNIIGTVSENISIIKENFDICYSNSNINIIRRLSDDTINESTKLIPINEFGKFKLTNLVSAAINLATKAKINKIVNKTYNKLKRRRFINKIKHKLFGESSIESIYEYIGKDNRVDICVEQYFFDDSIENDIRESLEEICKEFNNSIASTYPDIYSYYIVSEGAAELHIKDVNMLYIPEEYMNGVNKSISDETESYLEIYAEACNSLEKVIGYNDNISIEDAVHNSEKLYPGEYSEEAFEMATEALVYSGVDLEDLEEFYSLCTGSDEGKEEYINSIIEKYDIYSRYSVNLEAFDLFVKICEEAPVVKKVKVGGTVNKNDDKEKEKEKNEKAAETFSSKLNGLKLAMEGLKANFKDMNQKEKEISKNLDNNVTRLVKAMKDALISDRREAIIKGSVIPSFSKCIKIGIGLAGVGAISLATVGTALPAVILAIGGFALSKNLTRKERLLLLDDIETELDVIDKEIATAESRNQMKKYRKLLKIKKDLQRQYQRIKYNVRIGKDLLPGSTVGLKNTN